MKIRRELKFGLRINLITKETSPYQNRWKENCPSSPDLNNQPTRYKIHQIQRSGELYQLYPIKKHPLKIINWSPKRESKLMIYY